MSDVVSRQQFLEQVGAKLKPVLRHGLPKRLLGIVEDVGHLFFILYAFVKCKLRLLMDICQ